MARDTVPSVEAGRAVEVRTRAPTLTLAFSIVFGLLVIFPVFLSSQFGPFPLMKQEDAVYLLTPLVLLPLYWLLFRAAQDREPGTGSMVLFLVFAALWVNGFGMRVAANSIGHLLDEVKGGDAYLLTYFYDEVLGHYLWHSGVVGLSFLVMFQDWRNDRQAPNGALLLPSLAGVIYGFAFFLMVVEGQTPPLGVPSAVLGVLFGLAYGYKWLRHKPLLAFFSVAYLAAALLFAAWALYWGGLPEFSEVGIIK